MGKLILLTLLVISLFAEETPPSPGVQSNTTSIEDIDGDGINDSSDPILRHPLIDQTNGISTNIGEYTIELKPGWQMISLPVDTILRSDILDYPFTNNMNEFSDIYVDRYANFKIFGNYKIIWQYIDGTWKAYSDDETIKEKLNSSSYEEIEQLDNKHSFWIYTEENRLITFYGKEYIAPIESYTVNQWSMMSYFSGYHSFQKDMFSLTGIDYIWQYEDNNWTMNPDNINGAVWIRKTATEDPKFKTYMEAKHAYNNNNFETARALAQSISDFNLAKNLLGNIYYYGRGVSKDYQKAKEYFEASTQIPDSKHTLGYMYYHGYGVTQDYSIANQYYNQVINDNNYSSSFNNLGSMYKNGYGVTQNYTKAKEYYEKAADMGNALALGNLGYLYKNGYGVDKNIDTAEDYFVKSAFKNSKAGQYGIGYGYYNGECVSQDYTQAKKWFEKAAYFNEDSSAYNMLGLFYREGYGVSQDYTKAIEYYEKSMDLNPGSYATHNLGILYRDGKGVSQNYYKAVELFQLSADNGNKYGQANLAYMYANGYGITQNYEKAVEYYTLAANEGVDLAQRKLAHLYFDGNGVAQNYDTAFDWYKKAVDQGDTNAMTTLGWYYMDGLGSVTQNQSIGFEWYLKAAANGNSWAQNKIAYLYWQGTGTSVNKSKSYCWVKTSYENGYQDAYDGLYNTDWTGVYQPSDCSSYLETEINTYKIEEEPKAQCSNLDILFK